jgi:hypothetical protein
MPIEKNPGESKDDFISRCMSIEIKDGKAQDQAYAICITKYEEFGKTQSVTDNTWSTEAPISVNFKAQRRVIFNEDFNEDTVADYIQKGFKVHIRSSRKIQKRDRKVWNKLRAIGLTEDVMVFGEVKDLDKKYNYDLLMTGHDPILERLKLMGEDGSKYKILSSRRVDSIQEAFAAETELMKDVNLKFIRVVTRYTYEEIAGIPAAKKYGSRPFCAQLRSTPNRMYSLDEIASLSTRHLTDMGLPADVLQYRGGFYTNPDTGVTTAGCRHFWRVNVVVEQ